MHTNKQDLLISYNNREIPISIDFETRNKLKITVFPENTVIVKAPIGYSLIEVKEKIKKRVAWIYKQLNYFDQFHPITPERRYISGETHYYLGRQYRLKVIQSINDEVKLIGKYFYIKTWNVESREKKLSMMNKWYLSHAKILIQKRASYYLENVDVFKGINPKIQFRRMKKRWGSCKNSEVITFNIDLIKAPIHCVDYVILHELCHMIYENHDQKFFHLLNQLMPDWKKRKESLERVSLT
jgi:hypothetical protein